MVRPILSVLPPLCFLLLFLLMVGWKKDVRGGTQWRMALLASAVLLGVLVALGSELLSALSILGFWGILAFWSLTLLVVLSSGLARGRLVRGANRLRRTIHGLAEWGLGERALLAGLAGLVLTLFAVALVAAPNTTDSLRYHLARIAHWLQDGSLRHYAASYHNQLWSPIWAETAILHLMALWGGDRLANMVQWSAMVGSAIAITGIADQLGADRRAQLLAAVVGVTAPMAVLQATSTQTDLAVGFWVLTSVYWLVRLVRDGLRPFEWLLLGGSMGLGMLTKATFYPYVGLLTVGAFVMAWRKRGELRPVLFGGGAVALIVVVVNTGFWLRNLQTYGTPLGSPEMVNKNASARPDPRSLMTNSVQHLALNLPTPSEAMNEWIIATVRAFSRSLGQPAGQFEILWSWNHEDLAGNPIHGSLIGLALLLALLRKGGSSAERWYAFGFIVAFLAYAWTVEVGVYRVRYQLPVVLLGAPLVGAVAAAVLSNRTQWGLASLLLLASLPWLLFNQTRPILGWRPRTRTESVFLVSRADSLFANVPHEREPFSAAAEAVTSTGCAQIGLSIDSHDLEYLFWWLLGAPWNDVEIRVIRPLQSLEALTDSDFEACAVICTNCQGEQFRGMPLLQSFGEVKTFAPR